MKMQAQKRGLQAQRSQQILRRQKHQDKMKENLRKFNKADHRLYEAALARFEELKQNFGEQRLKDQVELLKLKRENLIKECTESKANIF